MSYQIAVHTPEGALLDLIDASRIDRLTYEIKLAEVTKMTLTLFGSDRFKQYANELDLVFTIYRDKQVEASFLYRAFTSFEDEGLEMFIVTGVSLEHILKRRLINPTDDPLGADGFSTKGGNADTVMFEYVFEQCEAPLNTVRSYPRFKAIPPFGVGDFVFMRRQIDDNLLDVLKECTEKGKIDFILSYDPAIGIVFEALKRGRDRTKNLNYPHASYLLFTNLRGNLVKPNYSLDRSQEITYLYLKGQGPEDQREIFEFTTSKRLMSIWNWVEGLSDLRELEDDDFEGFMTEALKQLNEKNAKSEFTFEIGGVNSVYRQDWQIGDYITASFEGIEKDLRIEGVNIVLNKNEEDITPIMRSYE